jgi:hypothetical protein
VVPLEGKGDVGALYAISVPILASMGGRIVERCAVAVTAVLIMIVANMAVRFEACHVARTYASRHKCIALTTVY